MPRDEEWVGLLQWALPRLRFRWPGFRKVRGQVIKRVRRRMAALGIESVDAYRRRLEQVPDEWVVLDEFCRITISRFWRDHHVFDALRTEVLPALAERGDLSVLSVGCASGEEPYSVVLAWRFGPASSAKVRIVGIDADARLLERARRAEYPRGTVKEVPPDIMEAGFIGSGETVTLREELRRPVELQQLDVREQLPDGRFDVVLCRNSVLTYFDEALRDARFAQILQRLNPGGALIVGIHEAVPDRVEEELRQWRRCVFRRSSHRARAR